MSSSEMITYSKDISEGFSITYNTNRETGKRKKSTNQQDQPDMVQQATSATIGVQQLQQQAVVQLSLLTTYHSRPTSSQSITGTSAGERPPSRALPVTGATEGQLQSSPPLLSLSHPQQAPMHTIPSSSSRACTPQIPFKTISQNSVSHISQISAPLFTEDRCSTSTDDDQEICDVEVSKITRQTPVQTATISIPQMRLVSTPSTLDYSTQGDPNHRENWKKAQDQHQFFNKDNRCLNCAANHRTCDCPKKQQTQTYNASNSANATYIYQNNPQFLNNSPQQHSQQRQFTLGISTPTLMVNNPPFQEGLNGQQQPPSTQASHTNQQPNFQVSLQHSNQQCH